MNAISDETRYRSEQLQAQGKLERLSIACGLTEPSMQQLGGLFVGEGRSDDKPLDDLLHAIDYWTKIAYPARGLTVCDTRARSTHKARLLHRDTQCHLLKR